MVTSFLTQDWRYSFRDFLSINVSDICSLLGRASYNILPDSFELRIGQWTAILICNHIVRCYKLL